VIWSTSCALPVQSPVCVSGSSWAARPSDWQTRAIVVRSETTGGVSGICPHPSDLAVSKLAAWREKDREFISGLLRHGLATVAEIEERLRELDPDAAARLRPRLQAARQA